ncbi:SDR family NAD(P)-dependent oxidoreductase [Streptomyces sp. Ag109_O5-10]|uniref:SDR family NAD(P)-dependent oxidoreductase n=1 Tax=Streptomyces sp. Ag109_O5-10 TaxID=1855349 RepID=UPI0008943A15|nr:SDR family NAD(P)-dependent oxidoreductase [Streptomyces sp. Ag109_O5-10]SEF17397.1 short chain dehydrogenase [Streptomyces sp. Ag109_O5-10]
MNIDLSGRTAWVSGSTAGIGAAVAEVLDTAGAEVVINGRNAERVAETARRLGARGVAADVGTPEGCDALIRQIPEADILVITSPLQERPCPPFTVIGQLHGIHVGESDAPGITRAGMAVDRGIRLSP